MYNFYSVAGMNGLGVYSSWGKAKEALKYLTNQRCKGFDNFQGASDYARAYFNSFRLKNYMGPVTLDFTIYLQDIPKIEMLNLTVSDRIRVVFDDLGRRYIVKVDEMGNIIEGMPMVIFNPI